MSDDRIEIHAGDITKLDVGAIVNAANEHLAPGGGVCGAIHRAAGPGMARECAEIGYCPAGEAELLAGCYRNCLALAKEAGLSSIAFPAISTGIYGYPLADATRVAVETVRGWLAGDETIERVVFCVFGADAGQAYRDALGR